MKLGNKAELTLFSGDVELYKPACARLHTPEFREELLNILSSASHCVSIAAEDAG
jgi:hypothetical protein